MNYVSLCKALLGHMYFVFVNMSQDANKTFKRKKNAKANQKGHYKRSNSKRTKSDRPQLTSSLLHAAVNRVSLVNT